MLEIYDGKVYRFVVPGEPRGKGRPRATAYRAKDGNIRARNYTPATTVSYENLIRMAAADVFEHPLEGPVECRIFAYLGIPRSAPRSRRARMLADKEYPTKKPDGDNIIKAVFDALNTVAFHDDVQVIDHHLHKRWSDTPRLEVFIYPMETRP
ncbi:MAG: RusA family crossover junction endodeoxyribonuclease [Alphaproteobacteria bacterium]|nr:RusA family crossover junction endodeoxyribonuclease [Alphaproteobacteria bacterium]